MKSDRAADRVATVDLPGDDIFPGWRERIFKVGHKDLGARVEGVDHHLALGGAGDLDTAVVEVGRSRPDLPFSPTHVRGFGQEGGQLTGFDGLLPFHPARQQGDTRRVKAAMEIGHKGQRFGRQHLFHLRRYSA